MPQFSVEPEHFSIYSSPSEEEESEGQCQGWKEAWVGERGGGVTVGWRDVEREKEAVRGFGGKYLYEAEQAIKGGDFILGLSLFEKACKLWASVCDVTPSCFLHKAFSGFPPNFTPKSFLR